MAATATGREVRISFRQFDSDMLGTCWCGRTWTSANPRQMWDWLDDHEHAAPQLEGPQMAGDNDGE
jgi:hypothetical protein